MIICRNQGPGLVRPNRSHPGYTNPGDNRWFPSWRGPITTGTAIAAVDTLYLYCFRLFFPIRLVGLRTRVHAGGASSAVKVGLWQSLPNTSATGGHRPVGLPLASDNTGVDTTTTGDKDAAITSVNLFPGFYWIGTVAKATLPTLTSQVASATDSNWYVGSGSAVIVNGHLIAQTYTNDIGALNLAASATIGGTSSNAIPVWSLKV